MTSLEGISEQFELCAPDSHNTHRLRPLKGTYQLNYSCGEIYLTDHLLLHPGNINESKIYAKGTKQ